MRVFGAIFVLVCVAAVTRGQYVLNGPEETPTGPPPSPPAVPGQVSPSALWIFKQVWLDSTTSSQPAAELPGMSGNGGSVSLFSPSATEQCDSDCDVTLATFDKVLVSGLTLGEASVPTIPTNLWIFDTPFTNTALVSARGGSTVRLNIRSDKPVQFLAGLTVQMSSAAATMEIDVDSDSPAVTLNGVALVEAGSLQVTVGDGTVHFPPVVVTGTNSVVNINLNAGSTWVGQGIDMRATTVTTVTMTSSASAALGPLSCLAGAEGRMVLTSQTINMAGSFIGDGCMLRVQGAQADSILGGVLGGELSLECSGGIACEVEIMSSLETLATGRISSTSGTNEVKFPTGATPYAFFTTLYAGPGATTHTTGGTFSVQSPGGDVVVQLPGTLSLDSDTLIGTSTSINLQYTAKAEFATAPVNVGPAGTIDINGDLVLNVTAFGGAVNVGDTVVVLTHPTGGRTGSFKQVKIYGWPVSRLGNITYVNYLPTQVEFTFTKYIFPPLCKKGVVSADPRCSPPPVVPPANKTDENPQAPTVINKKGGLSGGVIAGIIIAIILFVLIVVAMIVGFILMQKRNRLRDGIDADAGDADLPDMEDDRF